MRNIDELIEKIYKTVETHRLENEGEYARYLWQNEKNDRKMGLNEYGCADAANILYIINRFIEEPEKRKGWVTTLQNFQNPDTGIFEEPTHHYLHTTAHCIAALELFDAKPKYPLYDLQKYTTKEGLYGLLDNLKWETIPWPQSHQGAGIYAALKLTDTVGLEWERDYFQWLWDNVDEKTGLWKKGTIENGPAPLFHFMGAGFHYLFNMEYARKPLRYPEALIDTCLALYENKQIGDKIGDYDNDKFGQYIGFLEIDWVYCLTRAGRQTTYRHGDIRKALMKFAKEYIDWLYSLDVQTHDGFNDLHMLFGTTCALAELQQELRGMLETKKPLRLVLDRRPFI